MAEMSLKKKKRNTYSFVPELLNPAVQEGGLSNHGSYVPRHVVLEVREWPHAVFSVVRRACQQRVDL